MQNNSSQQGSLRSLSATLALAFAGLSIVVLIIAGVIQLAFAFAAQQNVAATEQARLAAAAAEPVKAFLTQQLETLHTTTKLGRLDPASPDVTRQVLQSLLGIQPSFRTVVFLSAQDSPVASFSRLPQGAEANLLQRLSPDVLTRIKDGNRYVSSVYIDPESSEPLVVMAVPARNVFGDLQGTLATEVNLKYIWDLVDRVKVGNNGLAFLVDRQGNLLAFRDTARVLKGENVANVAEVREFMAGQEPEPFLDLFPGINGEFSIAAFSPLEFPDWAIITEMPWYEAYGPAIAAGISVLLATIALSALAGLAGIQLARRLSVPLVNLTETAGRITQGQLNLQAQVAGPTEVAGLATAFNSMTTQLRQTLQELEQRVADRTRDLEASNAALESGREQLQANNAELEANRNQLQAANEALEKNQHELEHANQALQQNTAYLSALNDTTLGLMGRLDTGELLSTVVTRAATLLDTEHGYIYLRNPGEPEMTLRVGIGLYDDLVGSRTRPGRGLAGTVWETGKPLELPDYQQWSERLPDPRRDAIRSVIGVPLVTGDDVIGVIGLASTDPMREFGKNELDVLLRFAQLATIALENSRLFQQTEQRIVELSSLNRIGQVVATTRDMDTLIEQVGEQLGRIFDVQHIYIALYHPETSQVELPYVVNDGVRVTVPPMAFGEGLASSIIQSREPLLLNQNAETRADELGSKYIGSAAKSYLGVPIIVGDQALGVLSIQNLEQEGLFGDDDIRLLSTIASTVGVAIQNIRLYQQTRQSLNETERLAERERTVAEELQILTARLTGEGWQKYLEREPGDLWIEDGNSDLNGGHREIQGMQRAEETGSLVVSNSGGPSSIALPIVLRGQVIGTIGLEDLDPGREWNEDELSIVKEVSENVALALDNARLYTESQRRVTELDALNSISQAVTTELELRALLDVIGDQLQEIFGINNVYIALYDRDTETISLPYFVDGGKRVAVEPIRYGEGITSHIIRQRKPLLINNDTDLAMANLGAKTFGQSAQSYLGVPIFVGDDVTGVISIQNTVRENGFDDSNVRLLETVAATVGTAIQNAQLYGAMQQEVVTRQRAEEEIKISLKEKEVLLKEIHHRVKNNLQIITSLLNLQSAQLKDPAAITVFRESQSRVRSMALIHEKLYQSKDLARIDFDGYVRDLMVYLFRSYAANPDQIRTHIATQDMFLAIDTAIPCGLIISELVTNTIKYAFPNGKRGNLYISLGPEDDGHLTLLVKDDGVGFREGFDWRESDSLGLQLVSTLSSQLHGIIEVNGVGGASFKITFPG